MAKILIMEDDAEQGYLLGELLTNGGHTVKVAFTGGEAWILMQENHYDVLLTDMQVAAAPGIRESSGGLALIIQVRDAKGPNVPEWIPKMGIIAISGDGVYGKGALVRAETFGADFCLQKPIDNAVLLDAVDSIIAKSSSGSDPQQQS